MTKSHYSLIQVIVSVIKKLSNLRQLSSLNFFVKWVKTELFKKLFDRSYITFHLWAMIHVEVICVGWKCLWQSLVNRVLRDMSQNLMLFTIPQRELGTCGSPSKFTELTFKMCFEILDLWIESLNAFINQSELFLKDNLSFMLMWIC